MALAVQPRSRGTWRAVALAGSLPGLCGAWLYQSGHIEFFESETFLDLWIVVGLAVAGAAACVYAIVRGSPWLGAAGLVVNVGVVLLYGFLGLFFGLGGSR